MCEHHFQWLYIIASNKPAVIDFIFPTVGHLNCFFLLLMYHNGYLVYKDFYLSYMVFVINKPDSQKQYYFIQSYAHFKMSSLIGLLGCHMSFILTSSYIYIPKLPSHLSPRLLSPSLLLPHWSSFPAKESPAITIPHSLHLYIYIERYVWIYTYIFVCLDQTVTLFLSYVDC